MLTNKFSQNLDKNSIFLLNFHQKYKNFLKISQPIVFVVKKRENLTLVF